MKLYYFCKSCKRENAFTVKANNRYDLQKLKGKHISERCPVGFLLSILLSYFLLDVGWIIGVVFIIPILLWKEEIRYASSFNRVMIDD